MTDAKRSPSITQTKPHIHINFNRKVLDYKTLQAIKDTLLAQGMVTGTAIEGVVDDLTKLRYLCDAIVEAYNKGDTNKALQGINTLKLVL